MTNDTDAMFLENFKWESTDNDGHPRLFYLYPFAQNILCQGSDGVGEKMERDEEKNEGYRFD